MRFRALIIVCGFCLMAISSTATAMDYKDWIQFLPETFGGMPRSGEPEGMNMETGDQFWSSLHQRYGSDDPEKYVDLTLVGGNSPQIAGFQMMSSMKMETEEQIVKTIQVTKHKALLNLEKNEKRGTLMISLGENLMVVIEASPMTGEAEMVRLGEELPLDRFATEAK